MTEPDVDRNRDALFEAVLPHVVFDGWSIAALRQGGADLGLSVAEQTVAFPDGVDDLREYLDIWADRHMVDRLRSTDLSGMKRHRRVSFAVEARLEILAPHREAVRRALAARFTPMGAFPASRAIYRTVDLIWLETGDRSADISFYTKRATLAAVYTAALLHWLGDLSEGRMNTIDFLDRRLAQVARAPIDAKTWMRQRVSSISDPSAFFRSLIPR